nr:MAG TPA: hypothetical protein [Caudoviricetes sp.]
MEHLRIYYLCYNIHLEICNNIQLEYLLLLQNHILHLMLVSIILDALL